MGSQRVGHNCGGTDLNRDNQRVFILRFVHVLYHTDWFDLLAIQKTLKFSSVQFSHSVVSDSLRPRGLQHARPPCPSPTPEVHPKPCPLSPWCHPTISSSVVPFSYLQSFPASGSFPMSQLFSWGGQSIEVSASTSVLPVNIQGWVPLGWTGWISLQSRGLWRVFSNTTVQKHQFLSSVIEHKNCKYVKILCDTFFRELLFKNICQIHND